MKISRREFFLKTAQGITLAAIPAVLLPVIESCKNNPTDPSTSPSNMSTISATLTGNKITVPITSSSPLSGVGSAAIIDYSSGSIMVDRSSATTFNALSRVCTHQGCTISDFSSGNFMCACHGSRFNESGQVVQGPAASPLQSYATQFANNILTITLS